MSNPVGRPLTYKTPEEMQKGDVICNDVNQLKNKDFAKEINLVEYIIDNIDLFAKDYLDDVVKSFEIDKPILKRSSFSPRGKRVDIYIVGKKSTYILETKNPTNLMENRQGIGQLLDYGREFLDPKKELLLITTKFDHSTALTIKHYNLPIRYIYMSKLKGMEYKGEAK